MSTLETNPSFAKLILSTKRKKRLLSITEFAEEVNKLQNQSYTLNEISLALGLKKEMLNQFLSVKKLSNPIKELVANRDIDSVSMVFYLSKFNAHDQLCISNFIINGKLNSQDLKTLKPLQTKNSNIPIKQLIEKLLSSKNIKVSVIKFEKEELKKSVEELENALIKIVGEDNFIEIEISEKIYSIKITKRGESLLRNFAKLQKHSLHQTVRKLLN